MLTVFKSTYSRRRQATKNSLLLVLTIIWAVIYVGRKDQTRKNLLQNWNNVEQIEKRNVGKEKTKRDVQGKVRISNISLSVILKILEFWDVTSLRDFSALYSALVAASTSCCCALVVHFSRYSCLFVLDLLSIYPSMNYKIFYSFI